MESVLASIFKLTNEQRFYRNVHAYIFFLFGGKVTKSGAQDGSIPKYTVALHFILYSQGNLEKEEHKNRLFNLCRLINYTEVA